MAAADAHRPASGLPADAHRPASGLPADAHRPARRSFEQLTHEQLTVLVPELLLCGHLIDRSGMPHTIAEFGLEGMGAVAIDEWMAASPVYTKRMQRALGYEGQTIVHMFKGLQLDIGAPPQFMDFRYRVDSDTEGEFWLNHCGALMDVEPMGDEYVTMMCHNIEDPTFDATAAATHLHAAIRPIHRPPRIPANRSPHCAWRVTISDDNPEVRLPETTTVLFESAAGTVELSPIDLSEDGAADYAGPLLSDVRFGDFSRSALIRIAEEVCLQWHLLSLGYLMSLRTRTDDAKAVEIARKQMTGIAGLTAERIRLALELGTDEAALQTVLELHPVLNPAQYVDVAVDAGGQVVLTLTRSGGVDRDGGWPTLIDGEHLEPLRALVRGVNPTFDVAVLDESQERLIVEVVIGDPPRKEASEVSLTRFSTGADFVFADRGIPLPLTVVQA